MYWFIHALRSVVVWSVSVGKSCDKILWSKWYFHYILIFTILIPGLSWYWIRDLVLWMRITQLPQLTFICDNTIKRGVLCNFLWDEIHKSQNAPAPYPTMYHFEQQCVYCFFNFVLWAIGQMNCASCEIGPLEPIFVLLILEWYERLV